MLLEQSLLVKARFQLRDKAYGQINVAAAHHARGLSAYRHHIQTHRRRVHAQILQQGWQQIQMADVGHAQGEFLIRFQGVEGFAVFVDRADVFQGFHHHRRQFFGNVGGFHVVAHAHKQLVREMTSELVQAYARRWLADIEAGSGFGNAAISENGMEKLQ